jgi:hypothetical protein
MSNLTEACFFALIEEQIGPDMSAYVYQSALVQVAD